MTELALIPRIPEESMSLGADPRLLADELRYLIMLYGTMSPRSQQRTIGPSQVGTPCTRKLAYMVTEADPSFGIGHSSSGSWRMSVGTAIHTYLAQAFIELNADTYEREGFSRFLVETTVNVGTINRRDIVGHADLYDRVTATVVDWKATSQTTIKSARANGPSATYRVQAHLYGRGFTRRGLPVERVAIMYLPKAGEIRESFMWSEPYDESIALAALTRADATILAMTVGGGVRMLPALPTADDYCTSCPWLRPGIRVAGPDGCPGHMRAPAPPLPSAEEILGSRTDDDS
jgi:hypothetical protein